MTPPAGLTLASDHAAGESRPAILVIPGGGYAHYGPHEAEPVAHWFASLGLHAFVLRYPVAPHRHPEPLNAARAALGWQPQYTDLHDIVRHAWMWERKRFKPTLQPLDGAETQN